MFNIINKIFKKTKVIPVYSPLRGKLVTLEEVNDPVFANKILGEGFAIVPGENEKLMTMIAPISGNLTTVLESGHAYGITEPKTNIECLIHIGLDTVELKGKGFKKIASADQSVKVFDELVTVDFQIIKDSKKDFVTPVIFTKTTLENKYKLIFKDNLFNKVVNKGTIIAEIIKK